jgi:hypothetical protein
VSACVPGGAAGRAAVPLPGDTGCVWLDHGRFLRLRGRAGTTVVAVDGLLWVTRDGTWKDMLLEPGQRYLVPDETPVLVGAFGPSVARVAVPAPSGAPWWRTAGRLLGRRRPAAAS